MKAKSFTALALLAMALAGFAPRAAAEEKTPEQLIEQLRSEDFDQRRDAAARLEKIGDAARASLERAAKDDDPDVRASATKILARLLKATLSIYLVDYEGKALPGTSGEVTLGTNEISPFGQGPPNAAEAAAKPIPFKTNADGVASLKLESTGQIRLHVKIPGFVEENSETTLDARAGENVALIAAKHGATASGVVLGADGKPLKDAQIALYASAPGSLSAALLEHQLLNADQAPDDAKVAVTDQDGKWRLENVSDGVYVVCVKKAEGHFPALGAPIRLREGESKDTGRIALEVRAPGKLKALLKGKSGQPLAKFNVTISLTPDYLDKARRLTQQMTPYRQEEKESDEHGAVELDDLSPGKYRLLLIVAQTDDADLGATLADSTIEIKSGETAQVEAKSPEKGGSIKGRILSADSKGVKDLPVTLIAERDVHFYLENPGVNPPAMFGKVIGANAIPREPSVTDNKGVYRFENVTPGKYALMYNAGNDDDTAQFGYVFGVEVKPDARTEATDAVFKGSALANAQTLVTGRVLGADGAPIVGAEIHLINSGGDSSTASDEVGNFNIAQTRAHAREHAPRDYVIVRHSGYKPLAIQAPFQPHQECRLEKQDYGALRITVTDEAGKPVAGAAITPLASTVSTEQEFQIAQPLKGVTNSKGFVRMTGLAAGKRELLVQAPGYFLPEKNAEAEVVANDERELALTLHSGYRVEGRVTLPAGAAERTVIVTMDDSCNVLAAPGGAFRFDSVLPGEHSFYADAANMDMKRVAMLKLPRDPRKYKAESVLLEMAPMGGLAVDCGKELVGRHVSLMPMDSLSELDNRNMTNVTSSDVDADGRAEFLDIVPGQYLLSCRGSDAGFGSSGQKIAGESLAGPVEVRAIGTRAAIATLPAVKVAFTPGTAKVNARISVAGEHVIQTEQSNITITLKIRGERAIAETTLSDSISTLSQPPVMPLIAGTPPESFKPHVPGAFEIDALPAGSYKIFAALNYYTSDESDSENQQTGNYKQIAAFTIKDGETLDLGELKFEPDDVPDLAKPAEILKSLLYPIDRAQDFEP